MESTKKVRRKRTVKRKSSGKNAAKTINLKKLLIAGLILFAVGYFIYIMISQQIAISQKDKEISELEQKITEANQTSEQLQKELEYLNDPAYLESAAREKLGLVRPNERVFIDANKSDTNKGN